MSGSRLLKNFLRLASLASLWVVSVASAGVPEEGMRQPWRRSDENFFRQWLVVGPFKCTMDVECVSAESALRPTEGLEQKGNGGTSASWRSQSSYGDVTHLDAIEGSREAAVGYAYRIVPRAKAGKALLSTGSNGPIRIWVNGKLVLSKSGARALTHDEDQTEIDLVEGDNALLIKQPADGYFSARVLEPGTLPQHTPVIGPGFAGFMPAAFSLNTDVDSKHADAPLVTVEVIAPAGAARYSNTVKRGEQIFVDGKTWPDGPYDVRCSTRDARDLLVVTQLAWYKGDALAKARELASDAAKADATKPEGATLQMLANMVVARLGTNLADAKGNPWGAIHSPL